MVLHVCPPYVVAIFLSRDLRFTNLVMARDGDRMPLMALAETSMSQAMMLYLLANLQNLSATGRVGTKYEHLCIDSDKVPRSRAKDFAGYTEHHFESDGITAAHMITVFLIEIAREAEELKKKSNCIPRTSIIFDMEDDDGAFELKRNDAQAASGMHAMLDFFKNLIAEDISPEIRKLRKGEFHLDPPDVSTIGRGEDEGDSPSSYFAPEVLDDEEEGLLNGIFRRRHRLLRKLTARRNKKVLEIAHLQDIILTRATSSAADDQFSKDELKTLLEQAIVKRDFERLGFIKNFFREGSTSRLMVESKVEMVWINAWYPNECTYGISIDRDKKQVFCAFRGCFTRTDWKRAWQWTFTSTSNPITEEYKGRTKNLKINGGYHKYLFRARKDTGTTKFDEICTKLAYYCSLIGDEATITVTGHSLGAALGTVFSFYASTDERFTRNGAIQMVGFGGPYVGGYKFADAVRHQEAIGKLRIARFHVSNDGVSHLPPSLISLSKRGATYFNNGVDVSLPLRRTGIFKIFPQPQPRVTYNDEQPFLLSWLQQIREFYFFNLPIRVWLGAKMHTLNEHKKRMQLVEQLDDPQTSPLVRYTLEELYEIRDTLK
jgi:hypothetical protein